MMYIENTNFLVEAVLRQLKGYVPKGDPVNFHIRYTACDGDPYVDFTAIQPFDEADPLQPQTEPAIR